MNSNNSGFSNADARSQFNRQASQYAVSVPHSTGDSLRIVADWASKRRYEVGLDIATGPGFTAFAVAPFCDTMIASDIAGGMLEQARDIAETRGIDNVKFEILDAHEIPFSDDSIDLVSCRTAPHHFHDIPRFLSEVKRVLRPSGHFLLCDTTTSENPDLAAWHQRVEAIRDPSHVDAPSPSRWMRLLQDAGFTVTETASARVEMTFEDWVKRSGTPKAVIDDLRRLFQEADAKIVGEFDIRRSKSEIAFSWPVFLANCTV